MLSIALPYPSNYQNMIKCNLILTLSSLHGTDKNPASLYGYNVDQCRPIRYPRCIINVLIFTLHIIIDVEGK